MLLVALAAGLGGARAFASDGAGPPDDDARPRSAKKSLAAASVVERSSDESGSPHHLKWLPYRPAEQRIERTAATSSDKHARLAVDTRPVAPTVERPKVNRPQTSAHERKPAKILRVSAGATDAFKDPFEERKQLAQVEAEPSLPETFPSTEQPGTESSEPGVPGTMPEEALPTPQEQDYGSAISQQAMAREGCARDEKDCRDSLAQLKRSVIDTIDLNIDITGAEGTDFPCECKLGNEAFAGRCWEPTTFAWKASGLCHKPLYFEDVQLERYGHSWNPVLEPFLSGAHFFTSVALLPYKMGLNPPNECMYALGYYRPGSCAPYLIDPIPLSIRGAMLEAGAVTGGVFLFMP
jgi:hypothetical protein